LFVAASADRDPQPFRSFFGLALWRKKKGDPFWDRPSSFLQFAICGYRVELVRR
jgi:hypothetical protein